MANDTLRSKNQNNAKRCRVGSKYYWPILHLLIAGFHVLCRESNYSQKILRGDKIIPIPLKYDKVKTEAALFLKDGLGFDILFGLLICIGILCLIFDLRIHTLRNYNKTPIWHMVGAS